MSDYFEQSVIKEGKEIFKAQKSESETLFNKNYWLGRMMEWVMKDQSFKVDLFRFVDVLPMLSTTDQVAKHISEYLVKSDRDMPLMMNTALKMASLSLAKGLAAAAIKKNVTDMAQRFIAGCDIGDAQKTLKKMQDQGFSFTVDLLGEKTLSEKEADHYFERYRKLISELPTILRPTPNDPPNISLKVSALSCNLREEDPKGSVDDLKRRIIPILNLAKEKGVFINFDVESYQTHEIIFQLFFEIATSREFLSWPHLGIVVQAYLRASADHTQQLINLCKSRKTPITIRLVKGAYWDYEVVKAEQHGHACPVFAHKEDTDLNYEKLSAQLLDAIDHVRPAFGSHNIRSLAHAIAYAKQRGIDSSRYEIQMLYGMAETERRAFLSRGHNVRIYVPIGEMIPGMSYLVRRLLENTSQMGFLKLSHHDQSDEDKLLKAPRATQATEPPTTKSGFVNAHHTDFTESKARQHFADALSVVAKNLPITVPIVINGKCMSTQEVVRHCPADVTQVLSRCHFATTEHAELAIQACITSFPSITTLALAERARHLQNLAKILEDDRFLLAATMCYEVGKTWAEADADVAEAIDFCNYYADMAPKEIGPRRMGNVNGEHNTLTYQGRGPAVIIAPWNFPLAILCGMSVAAYVAGNPIIMKPSEQSVAIAYMLYERMIKAGFQKDAIQFLPGVGEEIGAHLVAHAQTALICFTGSMSVGHDIMKTANSVVSNQPQMKRVVCEMGGKNAIIIDDDADLDEAVLGVLTSAFNFAGQKCSAASRVIVIGSIKDQFVERLIAATASLSINDPKFPGTVLGPVIDQDAFDRLNGVINKLVADSSVRVLHVGERKQGGYYIPPVIVETNDATHWVMQEELFGPIVSLIYARDLEQAISIANSTKYALTGALFSRSPANIALVKQQFNVGNLYINQKCTGALVNRQPFGGFKMSGTGLKAGGPNYLINFVDAKLVSENTMRRGFTPEISI